MIETEQKNRARNQKTPVLLTPIHKDRAHRTGALWESHSGQSYQTRPAGPALSGKGPKAHIAYDLFVSVPLASGRFFPRTDAPCGPGRRTDPLSQIRSLSLSWRVKPRIGAGASFSCPIMRNLPAPKAFDKTSILQMF